MNKKKILIIDDESIITRALSRALKSEAPKTLYDIQIAENGKKGLELIRKIVPDLILLDMMMPEMTGLDVLEKMREERIEIPVIFMTAYGDFSTEKRAKELGVSAYLTKPFENIDDLLGVIKSYATKTKPDY